MKGPNETIVLALQRYELPFVAENKSKSLALAVKFSFLVAFGKYSLFIL